MIVTPIKTELIYPEQKTLLELIDTYITDLAEGSLLVIASKIVSLCEGSVADPQKISKDDLIIEQSQLYLNRSTSVYGTMITITKNSLMLAAGIDASNSAGMYVLWPKNPLSSAKSVQEHLTRKFNLTNFGVVIVDSTSKPMRIGTTGIALAHSGFSELNDYIGSKDLFGKKMEVSRANIAEGIAAAAVLAMGEGTEQTPFALIGDVPFVHFDPNESGSSYLLPKNAYKDDIYEPFWNSVKWHKGKD